MFDFSKALTSRMATRNIQVAIAEIFKLKNRTFITYFLVVQGPLKSCPSLPPTHERKKSLPLTLLSLTTLRQWTPAATKGVLPSLFGMMKMKKMKMKTTPLHHPRCQEVL
jgi:hypothetical protein